MNAKSCMRKIGFWMLISVRSRSSIRRKQRKNEFIIKRVH